MLITSFFSGDYCDFANYDVYRKIGNYIDGFKISSRKVFFTMNEKYRVDKIKLSQLANSTAERTQYLHGEGNLIGVAVGLAQDFPGSNNINLLLPEGSFGNRLIQEASAARYIFARRSPILDKVFIKDDDAILKTQVFEGSEIEYQHYIPIIPMILINGSKSIAVGFAQNIFPRNPVVVIEEIKKYLSTGEMSSFITPWYRGFKGEIRRKEVIEKNRAVTLNKRNTIEVCGKVEKNGYCGFKITEIPVGHDLKSYTEILNKLEDEKIIKSYKDFSQKNTFSFEIKTDVITANEIKDSEESQLALFNLVERDKENFTCLDENNEIIVFENEIELLKKFLERRLLAYEERKTYQLQKLKQELVKLAQIYKFISSVIEEKIVVFKRKKEQIILDLEKAEIEKIDDSYEYLLGLKIADFTHEQLEDLKKKFNDKKTAFQSLKAKSINNIYLEELDTLLVELKKTKAYV